MPKTETPKSPATYERFVSPRGQQRAAGATNMLTDRERDIILLAARGLSNQDIATELGISRCTVKEILHRACSKLGVQSRLEAIFTGLTQGYITMDEILSLDELASIFATMGPQVLRQVAQRLKQKQMDEMVNILSPLGPQVLSKVAQRLKQEKGQLRLPAKVA